MPNTILVARHPSGRAVSSVLALTLLLAPNMAQASEGPAEPELDVTADTPAARLAARRTLAAGVAFGGPAASLAPIHRRPNALTSSTSPYLQQHAWNPVPWQPWGEAAFARARREKKLIFLSVGYSTCHWCHVMEHETFESYAVAAKLAESFVCIKLDREERPDVDAFYMTALQAMTGGHGGWPMSMFLTPERTPFFGRTYLPREVFLRLLNELDRTWRADPETALQAGKRLTDFVRKQSERHAAPGKLSPVLARTGAEEVGSVFDPVHGGFGLRGPKFPRPMTFGFLLRMARRHGTPGALAWTRKTLDRMADGGIHDQLAGGFHRYSTDRTWTLPHFEKMLYDNGLLAVLYLEAWQLTGEDRYREVAQRTAHWIHRVMGLKGGGFASATDADTAGVEGSTFLWTKAEIRTALGAEAAREFFAVYLIAGVGGVPELPKRGVLEQGSTIEAAAERLKVEPDKLRERIAGCRKLLLALRDQRAQPERDDKLLTAWNGLAISALARVGAACRDEALITAAGRAADRILKEQFDDQGRLLRSSRDGVAAHPAVLDDYACFVRGLLDLIAVRPTKARCQAAIRLEARTRARFLGEDGRFVGSLAGDVPVPSRSSDDGARPAAAAVAAMNALRMGDLRRDDVALAAAHRVAEKAVGAMTENPLATMSMLRLTERLLAGPIEVVICGERDDPRRQALEWALDEGFLPDAAILRCGTAADDPARMAFPKFTKGKGLVDGAPAAWICFGERCLLPIMDPAELRKALQPSADRDESGAGRK